MMKKLFVLLMVISVASVANAGITLNPASPATVTPVAALKVQSDVAVDQQPLWLIVMGDAALDAGHMIYTGNLSAITDSTSDPDLKAFAEAAVGGSVSRLDFIELFDGSATPAEVKGDLVLYNALSGKGMVYLYNGDMSLKLSQVEVIPEPITIALLGLGGLMLRRRN